MRTHLLRLRSLRTHEPASQFFVLFLEKGSFALVRPGHSLLPLRTSLPERVVQPLHLDGQHEHSLQQRLFLGVRRSTLLYLFPRSIEKTDGGAVRAPILLPVQSARSGREVDGAINRIGDHVVRKSAARVHRSIIFHAYNKMQAINA